MLATGAMDKCVRLETAAGIARADLNPPHPADPQLPDAP